MLQTPFGYLEIAVVTLNRIIVRINLLRTCRKVQTAGMEISGYMGTHLALGTCIIKTVIDTVRLHRPSSPGLVFIRMLRWDFLTAYFQQKHLSLFLESKTARVWMRKNMETRVEETNPSTVRIFEPKIVVEL